MKVYSCITSDKVKLQKLKDFEMGVMISSHPSDSFLRSFLSQDLTGLTLALDNGAFSAYRKEECYNPYPFLHSLNMIREKGHSLEFVAVPDMVAGGMRSYEMSYHWATKMIPGKGLALVVQDGMEGQDLDYSPFEWIFVGGSVEWKWRFLPYWVEVAKIAEKKIHVGQVGTTERLKDCERLGVDSVDSTNFVRNDNWYPIEELKNKQQMELL